MIRTYTLLLSLFLLVEGTWGLFSNVIFGGLTTNTNHAIVHLLVGFAGLIFGLSRWPRLFNALAGLMLLASGLLYFVPGPNAWLVTTFSMNSAVAYVNIVLGTISLIMASAGRRVVIAH